MKRLAILLLAMLPALIQAQADDIIEAAIDNAAHEFASCAAYYTIVQVGALNSNKQELADTYKSMSGEALGYSLTLTKKNRDEEMALKVVAARVSMDSDSMIKTIEKNTSNISLLMDKYAYRCQWIMENPVEAVKEWTQAAIDKGD